MNINVRTKAALECYAVDNGISVTEAVRRLVGMGAFIAGALADGKSVELKRGRDRETVTFAF